MNDSAENDRATSSRRGTVRRWIPRLAVGLLVLAWFVVFRPTWLGGPAGYIVVAGTSMEPTYFDGTLVVTMTESVYAPGEVVAFAVDVGEGQPRPHVIHRIIGGNVADGYVTQGDNRPFTDPWVVRPADVLGRAAFAIPGFGQVLLFLRSPIVLASVGAAIAAYVVLGWTEARAREVGRVSVPARRAGRP